MRGYTAAVVMMIVMLGAEGMGRTYVVSSGGNDGAAGTIAAPWRTLAKANATLTAGDTVLVRAGTYADRIAPSRSGASGSPIVYRAYPGELAVVSGPDDTDLNLVYLNGSWVVIEGFTFRNQDYFDLPGKQDYWVVIEGHHNIFRYNRMIADGDVSGNIYTRNALSRGIAEAGQNNLIEHCFVRGLSFGIVIAGSSPRYTVVRYDTVYACGQNNIDVGSTADGTTAYHGTLIEYCVLDTSVIEDNIQFEPDYGDPTTTLHNRGTIIRYNRMGNAAENAIDLKGAGHTFIEYNLIYSSTGDDDGAIGGHDTGSGGGVTSNANTPTKNTIVRGNVIWDHSSGLDMAEGDHYYNNTIMNNRRTWQGPNQTSGDFTGLRAYNYPDTKRAFLNNIVAGQPNRGVFDWMMDWGDKFQLDHNLYYDASAPVRFYHRMNGSMVTTSGLTAWRNALNSYGGYGYLKGKDVNSVEANPAFINAPDYPTGLDPAWNFTPADGSAAVDAGGALTVTVGGATSSTTLVVDDAYFFCDGFGIIDGDLIRVGSDPAVRIVAINYATNTMTLAEPRTWGNGAAVYMDFNGNAPDIGAVESGSGASTPSAPAQARLLSPVDGALDVAAGNYLSWEAPSGAVSYHIQIALSSSFATTAVNQAGIIGTSYPVGALASSTTYYWRVRASNTGGNGSWSVPRAFTTEAGTGGTGKVGANLLNNGDFETGTSGWQFYTNGTGSFSTGTPAVEGSSSATVTITNSGTNIQLYQGGLALTAGTYYRLTFSAYSSTGHDMALGLMQHDTPYQNYGLWTRTVCLGTSWRKYSVYLLAQNFTGSVTDGRLQVWFPAFAKSGDVYHIDGMAFQEVDAPSAPSVPAVLSPASGAANLTFPVRIKWTGEDGVDEYQVQIARDAQFASIVCDTLVADTLVDLQDLDPATKYYHRIQARNVGGTSSFTAVRSFTTSSTKSAVEDEQGLPEGIELGQNYPNPFNPSTMIQYRLNAASRVKIAVYNTLGAEVAVLADGMTAAGEHAVSFNAPSLASGMYFYRLIAGNVVQTRRMMLVR
jgi:hypothetical protein